MGNWYQGINFVSFPVLMIRCETITMFFEFKLESPTISFPKSFV